MAHLKKRKPTNKDLDFLDRMDKLLTNENKPKQTMVENVSNTQDCIEYNNIKMPIKQIMLSDHAYDRAKERFNLKDKSQATGIIRKWLKKATLIGETVSEDGNYGITFTYEKREIILSTDLATVITVNEHQILGYSPIKNDIVALHKKEFNKLSRKERSKSKKLEELKLEADYEIAELRLRMYRTKSKAVENACVARINALKQTIKEREQEIKQLQSSKRQIARSMISIL